MTDADTHTLDFGGLRLSCGEGVIRPRPWTIIQSQWATELSAQLPAGPMLELCAGCGVIGLEAVRQTDRRAVLVDASDEACSWAVRNAEDNGLADRVEVRHADVAAALAEGERFPLILADPPYVPSDDVDDHPEDPEHAIDGGEDGLDILRTIVGLLPDHLSEGGMALVQVLGPGQATDLEAWMVDQGCPLHVDEVRARDARRAIVRLVRRT